MGTDAASVASQTLPPREGLCGNPVSECGGAFRVSQARPEGPWRGLQSVTGQSQAGSGGGGERVGLLHCM